MNSTALLFTLRPRPPPTSAFLTPSLPIPHLLSPRKWALRIHSAPQIKSYYIVIFHPHFVAPSLYILLTLSFSCLSPFSFLCLTLPLSPFPSPKKRTLMRWKMQVKGWGIFPFLGRNPINWRLCRPTARVKCWNCTFNTYHVNISTKWTTLLSHYMWTCVWDSFLTVRR